MTGKWNNFKQDELGRESGELTNEEKRNTETKFVAQTWSYMIIGENKR